MTASNPACSTTFAISRASVATTRRSQMPNSAMRRVTTTMRGSPPSGRSGLRGSRLEPSRAGITPRTGTEEDTKSVPWSLDRGLNHPQEVLQQPLAMLRPDGFGVELHPINGVVPVLHSHDLDLVPRTVGAHGRDHEGGREGMGLDHEGVVAHRGEGARNAVEQLVLIVHHGAGLAVHQAGRPDHLPAERLPDRLVAETDPEDRDLPCQGPDEGHEDAGLSGCLRARRQHDGGRLQRQHVRDLQRVVAVHDRLLPQLAQVLDEVVRERVVVVEDEEHEGIYSSPRSSYHSTRESCTASRTRRSRVDSSAAPVFTSTNTMRVICPSLKPSNTTKSTGEPRKRTSFGLKGKSGR